MVGASAGIWIGLDGGSECFACAVLQDPGRNGGELFGECALATGCVLGCCIEEADITGNGVMDALIVTCD